MGLNRYEKLMQRISAGEKILIDGGTGTEVERRGVPQLDNAWNGGGTLSHPQIVRQVHVDYLKQGAEIVISNTFATSHHALSDAGVGELFDDYNRRGVELALEARETSQMPDALVAGGISYWSWTGDHPPLQTLGETVAQQARVMADADADLLMLEMMIDIDRMITTLDAAQTSGLPVWVGLTCKPNDDGVVCLRNGEPLSDAVSELKKRDVPLISIMHSEVKHIDACLAALQPGWSGPIGVYAHTAGAKNNKWIFDDTITPDDYATAAQRWLDNGVHVIGGCCGIRAEHIAAINTSMA